ncbi:MAG: glycosyltransferase family 2 protein [Prevotella sp.]|nr:glycosyltransferase family 2 protein [Prevotella sp.]
MLVSFIILNYNGADLVNKCVASIENNIKKLKFEIIIIDNYSKENDYKELLKLPYKIIRSKRNLGFGGGNMLGANKALGDWLCFINSDVVFVDDCLSPLIDYMIVNTDVGVATPQQCNKDGLSVASFSHSSGIRHEIFKDRIFELFFPNRYPDYRKVTTPMYVDHINGCFMLFRSVDFWKIGGFDTNIFLYCEEYDVSRRLRRIGKTSLFYPNNKFLHLKGASTIRNKNVKRELYISRIYTYNKYHNAFLSAIYRMIIIFKMLFRPGRWYIIPTLLRGEVLSESMKHSLGKD